MRLRLRRIFFISAVMAWPKVCRANLSKPSRADVLLESVAVGYFSAAASAQTKFYELAVLHDHCVAYNMPLMIIFPQIF